MDLSACGPLCEAFLWSPTHCWHWYMRHEFYKTCYFFGMHVRRIRLIPKNLRVNIIDTVFFTVTCFVREVCLFWHVLPLSAHSTFFWRSICGRHFCVAWACRCHCFGMIITGVLSYCIYGPHVEFHLRDLNSTGVQIIRKFFKKFSPVQQSAKISTFFLYLLV